MFFLFQRVQQLAELKQLDLFRSAIVSDFLLEKDRLFARLTLADDELRLYEQVHAQLKPGTRGARSRDLPAGAARDPGRARRTGAAIRSKSGISESYLRALADSYTRFFHDYDAAPVLIVNTEHLNLVDRDEDFELLLDRMGSCAVGVNTSTSRLRRRHMSVHPQPPQDSARKPVTLPRLREMRANGETIAMLTCYDASFARLLDANGVDCVLVGDSLGMVIQGRHGHPAGDARGMAYHTRCVARGLDAAWLIADLPFGSYQAGPAQALAQRRRADAGRREDGEARGRRMAGADGRLPRRARHSRCARTSA